MNQPATPVPQTVYAAFAGEINQQALPRIFQGFGAASQGGVKAVHLLFQSNGGFIGDGIALYNYFRALPFDLHIYNAGSVQSIAVLAFLGAKFRHASQHCTFMIHKSHFPAPLGNAAKLRALAETLMIEDDRIEAILRANTNLPDDKWALHPLQDVTLTAQESVQYGLAHDMSEFQAPQGQQIFNV